MKVLVLDTVHPLFFEELPAIGLELIEEYQASSDQINWSDFGGLILRSRMPIDRPILEKATNLRFIARVGAGLENIDLDAAKELGIEVLAAPEGNRNALAEHALGMLLALFNRLLIADKEVRSGFWRREENRGFELASKTVGIIGYGYMGSAFAEKLRAMDCRILAYDKYKQDYAPDFVEEVSLEQLQQEADVISLHLPQNEETNHYVDEAFIANCRKPFYLVNTARGKNVSTRALVEALKKGAILGACLDVLEYEKSSFENLYEGEMPEEFKFILSSDRIIFSPHIAGWTHESNIKLAQVLITKIKSLTYDQ